MNTKWPACSHENSSIRWMLKYRSSVSEGEKKDVKPEEPVIFRMVSSYSCELLVRLDSSSNLENRI